MGRFRIKLRCMNGGGLSPGEHTDHILPESDSEVETFIVYTSEGKYAFRDESNDLEDVDVLAKLIQKTSATFSILLEPFVDSVFIEPSYSPKLAGLFDTDRISIPPSTSKAHHFIHIRPDDIISFKEDGLKIAVMAEIPDSTNSEQLSSDDNIVVANQHPGEVQVKSSNAEADVTSGDQDDDTDTSDDDLDQAVDSHKMTTPTARRVEQAIMETPQATTRMMSESHPLPYWEPEPYSTAQEGLTSDTVMLDQHLESPTAQVQIQRNTKANSLKDSPLAPSESVQPIDSPSGSDGESGDEASEVVNPYGKPQNRRAVSRQVPALVVKDTYRETERSADQDMQDAGPLASRDSPNPAATSDPLDPGQAAAKAASRSMVGVAKSNVFNGDGFEESNLSDAGQDAEDLPASNKRKASDVEDEEDDIPLSSRKRKVAKVVDEQYEDEERIPDAVRCGVQDVRGAIDETSMEKADEDSDAGDSEPLEDVKPATNGKKGKMAKPTRRKTKSTSRESSAPSNFSPVVVVAAQLSTRKRSPATSSPASSAASSALTRKPPNILLSSDSACRKGDTATFLKKLNATIIDDVKTRRTDFVCVTKGDKLTTTAKVLRSLALGKLVVTEDWITESKEAKRLLDPGDFVHPDLKPTIHVNRSNIFQNTNLFFTKTLASAYGKAWKDIQELAKEAGASHIESGDSGTFGRLKEGRLDVICFGQGDDDVDVPRLKKSHRVKVYHKNLLIRSIVKGELDIDGEEHVLS